MLTEQTHTEPNWKLLPGAILDGGYEMEELLEADERRARFKIRVLGDRTIDAIATFLPVGGTAAQDQIEAWELLRLAPHPNVSKPLASGQRELDGTPLVYVVTRTPQESLQGVLGERALTGEEASEVLLSGARALEYLGRHGLVHRDVSPGEVLAVGDSIQLSAEGVRKSEGAAGSAQSKTRYVAPEATSGNFTTASGVWCLGATVFETLTQRMCEQGCREQAKELPLGWVLQACLEPEPAHRAKPEEIPVLIRKVPASAAVAPAVEPAISSNSAKAPSTDVVNTNAASVGAAPATVASAAAAGAAAGMSAPAKPAISEPPAARPAASTVSQARTQALKREFDALTAPQSTAAASAARASASAALGGSLGSPVIGAAQASSPARAPASPTISRPGNKFDTPPPTARRSGSPLLGADAGVGRRPARAGFGDEAQAQPSRLWMYVAAAALVVVLLIWVLRSKPSRTANAVPAAATPATQTTAPAVSTPANNSTAANSKAWPTRTLEPDKSGAGTTSARLPAVLGKPSSASKPAGAVSSAAVWRVVVYTFNRQEDAEKKVRTINSKHPRLEAQVFSPSGHSSPYLVTVGGRMTREDAARFRRGAVGSGLPRDSYIQNYKP